MTRSYWLDDALAAEDLVPGRLALREHVRADVCIVGGGYTGLWTAIELKRRDPSLDVVLVEATVCGAGASGTNAGIAMNLWPKLSALVAAGGRSEALMVARASVGAVDHLVEFCADHDIDAQVERSGWLWASTNSSQDGAWDEAVGAAQEYAGSPFRVLDAAAASERAGTAVRGGVLDPTCAHLHPGRLVRGLARAAEAAGVRIHERSPMQGLGDTAGDPVVRTADGSVRASSVVLAINAWASRYREFRRHLVMTASDNLVVEPVPGGPRPEHASVSDSGRMLDYWRPLADGKVLFGKAGLGLGFGRRGATTLFGPVPRLGRLRRQLGTAVPALAGAPVVSSWRAPVEYSLSSLPFFTALSGHPRVFCGTGYSGDGVGPSVLGGRILAGLATGVEDELSTSFLTRAPTGRGLPPEPFRFLGGQAVKVAYLRRDRLEDAERPIGPVTRAVTRIDPTSFVG
ncbi:FAD-dependent oxidoreductase [Nocardioides sp. WV_118_6]